MRPFLALLLLLLLALTVSLTGCKKKKGEDGTDATVQADTDSEAATAEKPKKKSKRKGKKKGRRKGKKGDTHSRKKAVATKPGPVKLKAEGAAPVLADSAGPDARPEVPGKGSEPRRFPAAVKRPPVTVAVARLLTVIDVNRLLDEKGWIAYGPVQGIPPSEFFNSLIYRKPGTNRFVTILVWDFPQYAQALEKWNEMAKTYPNTQELKEMFSKFVFFSYRNQVSTLTALSAEESTVLSVSCHTDVCDDTALYEMAKTAFSRIK